jgi:hypothetical protein
MSDRATRSANRANGSASSSNKKPVKKSTTNKKDNKKGSASHGRSAVGNGNVSPGDLDANDEERPDSPSSTSSEGRPKESLKPTKQSSGQHTKSVVNAPAHEDIKALAQAISMVLEQRQPSASPTRSMVDLTSTRRVDVRLRDVTPYKGTAGEALDAWIDEISLHHDNYVVAQGASEAIFIAAVAPMLKDAAVVWWRSIAPTARPKSWSEMQTALRAQFQPFSTVQRARREFRRLEQSAKQSVVEYASAFRQLVTQIGAELAGVDRQPALTEQFIDGLRNEEIRSKLMQDEVKELDVAIRKAVTLESCTSKSSVDVAAVAVEAASMRAQLAALTAEMQSWKKKAGNDSSSSSSSNGYDSRRDRGANKGSFNASANRIIGLTGEMAKHRRENGLCLYCAGKDHIVRDCPDRVAKKSPTLN